MNDLTVTMLQQGKERIAQGWVQGRTSDGLGHYCAVGALCVSTTGPYDDWRGAFIEALESLRETTGCGVRHAATTHNDKCLSSQADVLDWFDRAIVWAKDQPTKDAAA